MEKYQWHIAPAPPPTNNNDSHLNIVVQASTILFGIPVNKYSLLLIVYSQIPS